MNDQVKTNSASAKSDKPTQSDTEVDQEIVICALYHFAKLDDFEAMRSPILSVMTDYQVRGTLLLAQEGINGTIAGSRPAIDGVINWLREDQRLAGVVTKESFASEQPFYRTKVKLKREIVTMGMPDIDPKHIVGTYVKPEDWNRLISDPEVTVIDTRNEYEVNIGTFEGAVNPHTTSFREFPEYVATHLSPDKHKKVAMFCTGGIRCEKSTAFLKEQGFEDVYHLEGGILKYLEEVPEDQSLWQGECFVFDNRVTVDHQLNPGLYDQCHACRMPITETEKRSNAYQTGISCPHCIDKTTPEQKARFRERQHQLDLAAKKGETHIGSDAIATQARHREDKRRRKEKQRQQGE